MYPELTDEALAALLKQSDPAALQTLFDRYYKSLCQYCAVYTMNFAAAEELIADLFIKMWEVRQEAAILNLKNYLFVSARNMALNYKQKKKAPIDFVEMVEDYQHLLTDTNTPFQILSGRESYRHILKVIATLPERQREVLLLSRVDDIEKHKIAELLGISVRTVETTLYQSIKQLRSLLKKTQNSNPGA